MIPTKKEKADLLAAINHLCDTFDSLKALLPKQNGQKLADEFGYIRGHLIEEAHSVGNALGNFYCRVWSAEQSKLKRNRKLRGRA